jgi:hypothetical protein
MAGMSTGHGVAAIELSPIFAVARESEAFAVSSEDFVVGVRAPQLIEQLEPDQHLYLVHMDDPGPGLGVKLTQLT